MGPNIATPSQQSFFWDGVHHKACVSSHRCPMMEASAVIRPQGYTGFRMLRPMRRGGGGWHKASGLGCLPLAAPIGLSPIALSPLPVLTLCGSERVLVVSTEPLDDWSCLTTLGVGCPGDGLLPVPLARGIQMHTPSPCGGLPTPALTCAR